MSCYRPFCRMTSLVGFAVAAMVLLTPAQILPARAQAAQQATLDSQQRGFGDSTTDDSGLPGGGLGLSRGAYPVPRLPGLK